MNVLRARLPWCVTVDLDNTIVDTAVRKCAIAMNVLGHAVDLISVRRNFAMTKVIGSEGDDKWKSFFGILNSSDGVDKYPAPAFDGVIDALKHFQSLGIEIVIQTARPEAMRECTYRELANLGLQANSYTLVMAPTAEEELAQVREEPTYKRDMIGRIIAEHKVLTLVGDRPYDIDSSEAYHIKAILFKSTISEAELSDLRKGNRVEKVCESWREIRSSVELMLAGAEEMERIRPVLIDDYSRWLHDIDFKGQTHAIIAIGLAAFCAQVLLTAPQEWYQRVPLMVCILAALVALAYATRAISGREASGPTAGSTIKVRLQFFVGTLLGWPKPWTYRKTDAIDQFETLRSMAGDGYKRTEHWRYFVKKYESCDPDALLNLRMLELRAVNYAKVYAERLSSYLILIALVFLMLWVITIPLGPGRPTQKTAPSPSTSRVPSERVKRDVTAPARKPAGRAAASIRPLA